MKREEVEELYIKPLKDMQFETLRLVEEQESVTEVILDGEKEDFFLSFMYEGRVDICWRNVLFIFDKGRNLLTSEDTYGEIVYEALEDLSSKESTAEIVLRFIEVLNDRQLVEISEIDTGEKIGLGCDKKKNYVVIVSGKNGESNRWKFANVEMICK